MNINDEYEFDEYVHLHYSCQFGNKAIFSNASRV